MRGKTRCGKIFVIFMATVLFAGALPITSLADETATSMKLTSTEGKVKVSNGLGRKVSPFNGMNLTSGYHVLTEEDSSAFINMDDTKLATVGELTDVDISKQNEDLELHLNRGDVTVSVTQKVPKTATVKVRFANITMGIAGTDVTGSNNPVTGVLSFGCTNGTSNVSVEDEKLGKKAVLQLNAGLILDVDTIKLMRGLQVNPDRITPNRITPENISGSLYDAVTLRSMEQKDVNSSMSSHAHYFPEVISRAALSLRNIDLTDHTQYTEKRAEDIRTAQELRGGGDSGSNSVSGESGAGSTDISAAFEPQEAQVKKEEADAKKEQEKDLHSSSDSKKDKKEDKATAHRHRFADHVVRVGIEGPLSSPIFYVHFEGDPPGECLDCHEVFEHTLTLTKEPSGLNTQTPDITYSWRCSCGATGSGELEIATGDPGSGG